MLQMEKRECVWSNGQSLVLLRHGMGSTQKLIYLIYCLKEDGIFLLCLLLEILS
ncbi:hypothetical protein CIPAW_09G076600 [Carya illinoinensis]|uniref:Uncharacterized protein n=1 Tax=Carya illinoinensis TaxID=32201 RepID=A0A8T1PI60_CARIL|nr:hypothetical protein CIPAW_09G076600 [Carya illinoinensis]